MYKYFLTHGHYHTTRTVVRQEIDDSDVTTNIGFDLWRVFNFLLFAFTTIFGIILCGKHGVWQPLVCGLLILLLSLLTWILVVDKLLHNYMNELSLDDNQKKLMSTFYVETELIERQYYKMKNTPLGELTPADLEYIKLLKQDLEW